MAKGLCRPHYMRWHRTGVAEAKPRDQVILDLVDRSGGDDACWPWTGHVNEYGYGRFGKPARPAHQVVFEVMTGRAVEAESLDHECHNLDAVCQLGIQCPHRRCCNPRHVVERDKVSNASRAASTRGGCKKAGHPWTPENTSIIHCYRRCRACHRERQRQYEERRA